LKYIQWQVCETNELKVNNLKIYIDLCNKMLLNVTNHKSWYHDVYSEARTVYPSESPEFTPGF